jgi:hypothetical protein
MSLLKLLATGRSWVGMPDTNSRYRMRRANLLPTFGGKNPFATPAPGSQPSGRSAKSAARLETGSLFESNSKEPKPAPRETAKPAPAKEIVAKEIKIPAKRPTTDSVIVPAKVEAKPAIEAKPAARPALLPPRQKPARWSAWVEKFNPLSLLPHRGEGSRGRPTRKHVQTELTLEKVRVVRNDLSDMDFEIVPGRLMGLPASASPILPHPANTGPGTWDRLTSKFLGAQHAEMR